MAAGDTVRWTGSTSGAWDTDANWNPAAKPIDQEHVVIPETATRSITSGLDRTGDTAGAGLDLRSLYVHEGFAGGIGTSGNPLKCTVDHTVATELSITHRGSGSFFYDADTGSGGHTTGRIAITSLNMDNAFTMGGDVAVAEMIFNRGKSTVTGAYSGTITRAWVTYVNNPSIDALVEFLTAAAGVISRVMTNGGVVVCDREVASLIQGGGHWTQNGDLSGSLTLDGGTHIFNSADTLPDAFLKGGTMDTTKTSDAKVITDLYKLPGATFLTNLRTTVTNTYKFDIDDE